MLSIVELVIIIKLMQIITVQQLTIFSDAARLSVLEVRQTFALRKDRLATRIRYVPGVSGARVATYLLTHLLTYVL